MLCCIEQCRHELAGQIRRAVHNQELWAALNQMRPVCKFFSTRQGLWATCVLYLTVNSLFNWGSSAWAAACRTPNLVSISWYHPVGFPDNEFGQCHFVALFRDVSAIRPSTSRRMCRTFRVDGVSVRCRFEFTLISACLAAAFGGGGEASRNQDEIEPISKTHSHSTDSHSTQTELRV